MAVLAASSIHVATQWERVIVLRLGTFKRVEGPGLYFTIPFVERAVLRADMRTMLTGFGAEETLTSDLVPVDVDAAVFWMVWDTEKACMEVENYYDAVSMAAQTALRDAIGRKSISDITVHRDKLDQELRDKIEEKAGPWGISIISVEIRDIVIPKELQRDMAAAAKAEREKDARIISAEVEKDVAAMLLEATEDLPRRRHGLRTALHAPSQRRSQGIQRDPRHTERLFRRLQALPAPRAKPHALRSCCRQDRAAQAVPSPFRKRDDLYGGASLKCPARLVTQNTQAPQDARPRIDRGHPTQERRPRVGRTAKGRFC